MEQIHGNSSESSNRELFDRFRLNIQHFFEQEEAASERVTNLLAEAAQESHFGQPTPASLEKLDEIQRINDLSAERSGVVMGLIRGLGETQLSAEENEFVSEVRAADELFKKLARTFSALVVVFKRGNLSRRAIDALLGRLQDEA